MIKYFISVKRRESTGRDWKWGWRKQIALIALFVVLFLMIDIFIESFCIRYKNSVRERKVVPCAAIGAKREQVVHMRRAGDERGDSFICSELGKWTNCRWVDLM